MLNFATPSELFGEAKKTCMQVLQFVHQCAAQLGDAGESAEMALQLFLTAAYSASEHAKSELIAYEFFEQVTTSTQDTLRTSVSHDFWCYHDQKCLAHWLRLLQIKMSMVQLSLLSAEIIPDSSAKPACSIVSSYYSFNFNAIMAKFVLHHGQAAAT